MVARHAALPHPLLRFLREGWDMLDKMDVPDVAAAVRALHADPRPFVNTLARYPLTLAPGDLRPENIGLTSGAVRRTVLIDWQQVSAQPPVVDLAWLLNFFEPMEVSKEDIIEQYREQPRAVGNRAARVALVYGGNLVTVLDRPNWVFVECDAGTEGWAHDKNGEPYEDVSAPVSMVARAGPCQPYPGTVVRRTANGLVRRLGATTQQTRNLALGLGRHRHRCRPVWHQRPGCADGHYFAGQVQLGRRSESNQQVVLRPVKRGRTPPLALKDVCIAAPTPAHRRVHPDAPAAASPAERRRWLPG